MATVQVPVSALLWVLFLSILAFSGYRVVLKIRDTYSSLLTTLNSLAAEADALRSELAKTAEAFSVVSSVPGYLKGLVAVCESQVVCYEKILAATNKLTGAVETFTGAVVERPEDPGPPQKALKDEAGFYDAGPAGSEGMSFSQMVDAGWSQEAAREEVEAQKKTYMNPGV
jgi:hypothetical protein